MNLYNYKAMVIKVIDGDTVKLSVDLGFRLHWDVNCRLAGINAKELGSGGEEARDHLKRILPQYCIVDIVSRQLDKYGRPVVEILYNGININTKMLNDGMAVKY